MEIGLFDYSLPQDRIARFPLGERDSSRLLVWRGGEISETVFRNIGEVLPPESTLVFNDTRVVRARLTMFKPSGGRVEILCLEPYLPVDYESAFAARGAVEWRVMIGGAKKWKSGPVEIRGAGSADGEWGEVLLRARRIKDESDAPGYEWGREGLEETLRTGAGRFSGEARNDAGGCEFPRLEPESSRGAEERSLSRTFDRERSSSGATRRRVSEENATDGAHGALSQQIVRFEWAAAAAAGRQAACGASEGSGVNEPSPAIPTFGELLEKLGGVPIPPYLDRQAQEVDNQRYQTVYAAVAGSVAAPTAGLHFTPEILDRLGGETAVERVTLHVGAGTFLPVKTDDALEHEMHTEHFEVSLGTIERLAERLRAGGRVVAVGTTSVRTLESLAVLGWRLKSNIGRGEALFCSTSRPAWSILQPKCFERASFAEINFAKAISSPHFLRPASLRPCAGSRSLHHSAYATEPLEVAQFSWRDISDDFSGVEALENLARWMRERGIETLSASTRIMIAPGYRFRVVGGLVTNFHQPKSTLLLLVSAFLGDQPPTPTLEPQSHEDPVDGSLRPLPRWREIYDYALAHDFRFLSYGDSSLLLP